ncbi:MAG TPA: tripartite tricarboxylate transporter substrate binding protein [Ramlibacter sp.]|nr:tripartite tricarboxylate transporter substrate binding protein [Ramlibacter sp.]
MSTAGLLLPGSAMASQWPERPVRMVVPFAAGGATDLLGRALGVELGRAWKQSVIVDNRGGAGGALGAEVVARASADGLTLLLASGSMFTVNPHIYQKLPYSDKSFEMITKVAGGPMVVTINSEVPAKNLQELIALGKKKPGSLSYASAGNGSQVHMAGAAFADASDLDLVHVPYKGEGPAYADLMAGVVQMAVGNINAISPLLKGGRLRALAVTGAERSPLLPEVPTASEAGLPGFEFVGWFGLVTPAGTPQALIAKIDADVRAASEQPGMKRYLADQGMYPMATGPDAMKRDIPKESQRWKTLVSKRNIKA